MRTSGNVPDDIIEIFELHPRVPALFRIEHDVRAFLAGAETHVGFYLYVGDSFRRDALLQFAQELFGTSGFAVDVLANETNSHHHPLGKSVLDQLSCICCTQSFSRMMLFRAASSSC